MTLISDVFPKLRPPKKMVRKMSKKSHFWGPFDKQHVKLAQTLLKSEPQNLKHVYWSLKRQLSSKKSLLVICKVSRLFVNALTADDKYSLLNRDNLTQPIQTELSQRQKKISQLFLPFWNAKKILNTFKKKMTLIADVFPKLRTLKNVVK